MSPRMVAAILRSIAQSSVTHGKWNIKGSILSPQSESKFRGMFLKLATKSPTFFCRFLYFHMFVALCLSPHPASATIRGVVQSLGGVGEQGVAIFLQVDEVAVGSVSTTRRETAGGVGRDIEATGSGGKDLTADRKQVAEGAVGVIGATRRPGATLVGGHLDGVVAWIDAEELSLGEEATAGFDDLWHSMMFI